LLVGIGFISVFAGALQGQQGPTVLGSKDKEQHTIYGSSATATGTLSFDNPNFTSGQKVFIHVKLESHVGREIMVNPDGIKFDVRDATGKRPKETEDGCQAHFFSQCYTGWLYRRKVVQIPFKSFDKLEWDKNLSKEYELQKPGTYTVIGYVCGISNLTDCFRTNELKFTVK
jgi:hypothetical protein